MRRGQLAKHFDGESYLNFAVGIGHLVVFGQRDGLQGEPKRFARCLANQSNSSEDGLEFNRVSSNLTVGLC